MKKNEQLAISQGINKNEIGEVSDIHGSSNHQKTDEKYGKHKNQKDQNNHYFQNYPGNQRDQKYFEKEMKKENPLFQSPLKLGRGVIKKGDFDNIRFDKSPTLASQNETSFWDCSPTPEVLTVTCSLSLSGQFSISGDGPMKNYSASSLSREWYEYRTKIISLTTNGTVSAIGTSAFSNCDNLTTLNFGPSLTTLHSFCFQDCDGLTTLSLGANIILIGSDVFSESHNLQTMIIPGSVVTIGPSAFYDCTNLAELTIEYGVQYINSDAFKGCSKLGNVTIPGSIISISQNAFNGCTGLTLVIIEKGVQTIYSQAFYGCKLLTAITIPQSITSISWASFLNCPSLTNITVDINNMKYESRDGVLIDKTTKSIIQYPGGKLGSYQIPSDIITIYAYSFGYSRLTSLIIPITVTNLLENAFEYSSMLSSVSIPGSVSSVGNYAFSYCTKLSRLTLQNGIKFINSHSFLECSMLASVTIPGSVSSIGYGSFGDCTNLSDLTLQNGIKTLGIGAFRKCSKLTSVIIPSSVTEINSDTFNECTSLECIAYRGLNDPGPLSSDVFSGCPPSLVVHVSSLYQNHTFCQYNKLGNESCPISNTLLFSSLVLSNSFDLFFKISIPLFLFF